MKYSLRSLMLFADPGMGSGFLVTFAFFGVAFGAVAVGVYLLLRSIKSNLPAAYSSRYGRIALWTSAAILVAC